MKDILWLVFKKILKNLIFRKLLIKKIENFFGKTLWPNSSPYSNVTGAWQGTSRVKLYEELGWESLSDRRISRRVLQIHKIIDKKTPTIQFSYDTYYS